MRHVALVLALVAAPACDDADTVPVQPSRIASALTLTAFPTTVLRSGSDVRVTVRVTDGQGGLVEGTAVTFTSTSGSLSTSSASTSSNGAADVTLSASDATRVTASLPTGASAALDLPAVAPFTLTLDRPSTVLVAGTTFGVQITPNASVVNPPAPTAVTINCGFGSAVDVTATRTHRCEFPSAGDFTVEAAARTANGWTLSERAQVTAVVSATSPVPPSPSTSTLSVSVAIVGGNERRITATAQVPIREFRFIFDDRTPPIPQPPGPPAETKRFDGPGSFTASAQYIYANGDYKATVRAEPVSGGSSINGDVSFTVP